MIYNKSKKESSSILPLQNIKIIQTFCDTVFEEDEKCEFLNKYINLICTQNNEDVQSLILCNINIGIDEIIDVFGNLDSKKASGPETIPQKMLTIGPEKVTKPFQIIFNKFHAQYKYPSA